VRLSSSNILAQVNDKREFVRLTARWKDLDQQAHPILEQFVSQRLLVKTERDSEIFVEVAHEAILPLLGPLKQWLNASVDILRWRRDIDRDQNSALDHKRRWSG